jgi:predicted permease
LRDPRPYLITFAAILLGLGVAFSITLASRLSGRQKAVVAFSTVFGNTAYLGIPFVRLAVGAPAVGIASAIAGFSALIWLPLGLALIARAQGSSGRAALRTLARTPLIYAAILGVVGSGIHGAARLPDALPILDLIGTSASPVALFAVGAFLATIGSAAFRPAGGIAATVVGKLLAAPIAALALCSVFGVAGTARAVVVVEAAMPTGLSAFVGTEELGGEAGLVAGSILATTALSVLTLALLLSSSVL